jgi:hypothetical protein
MFGTKTPPVVIRIKLTQTIAGHRIVRGQAYVFSHGPHAVLDWPADEARRFIESGIATLAPEGAETCISPLT